MKINKKILIISVFFSVAFWIIDSFVNSTIFQKGTFVEELFETNSHEVYMRFVVFVLLIGFGIILSNILYKRKIAEEAKFQSEEKFKEIFENTASCIAVYRSIENGTNFAIQDFNTKAEQVEKVSKELIIGKKVTEIFPGITEFGLFKVFQEVWKTGKPQYFPVAIYKDDRIQGYKENYVYKLSSGEIVAVYQDLTKRKQAEMESKQNKKLLRTVLDIVPIYICAKNLEGRFILINKKLADFYGKSIDEMTGMLHASICEDEEELKSMLEADRQVIENGKPVYIPEETMLNPDGSESILETYKIPFEHNHETAVLIASADITERKKVEIALVRSEEKFRDLAELLPEAVFETDEKFNVSYANKCALKLFGYSAQELKNGINGLEIIAPKDIERLKINYRNRLKGMKIDATEYEVLKKDGTRFPALLHADSIFKDGKMIGLRGIIIDITKRKEAEEKIRTIAENYQITSEKTGQMVYDYDPRTGKIIWGGAVELLTGYEFDEFQKVDIHVWETMVHPDDIKEILAILAEAESACSNYDVEYRFRKKDGSFFHVEEHGVFLPDSDGKAFQMLGSINDISERKKSEKALRDSEAKYRSFIDDVLDTSDVGIFILNPKFEIVWINKQVEKFFGLKRNLIVGKNKKEVIHSSIQGILEDPETFKEKVFATYEDNTYTESFECHVLPTNERKELWLTHWSQPIKSGLYKGGRIEHYSNITERKYAEKALQSSEERFHTLFTKSSDVNVIMKDGIFVDCNEACLELLQTTREEFIGSTPLSWSPEKQPNEQLSADIIESIIQRILNNGSSRYEWLLQRKDGSQLWVEIVATVIGIDGNDGIFGVWRDVSERKEAEKQLAFQSMLLDKIQDKVTATDLDGTITYVNEAESITFGKPASDLIGRTVQDYGEDPKLGATQFEIIEKTRRDGTWHGEVVNIDKNNEKIIFDCRTQLIYDDNNNPIGMLGISTDITEKKKIDRQLKERVKELRVLFALSKFAEREKITVDDLFQKTVDIIPAGFQYPEITSAKIIFKGKEYLSENFKEDQWKLTSDITGKKKVYGKIEVIYNAKKADDFEGPFLSEERLLIDSIAETLGHFAEKKQVEKEMADLEEQFRQAQKMEAIGVLAGGVAHDFNNILNVILGYSDLLMRDFVEEDPSYQKIENIKKNVERATRLTGQLLAFSRKQILQPTQLNLNEIVGSMEKLLYRLIGENIEFISILSDSLHFIMADEGQIEQVIMNIVVNAKDAMADGGKLIIETKNVEIDEEYAKKHKDVKPGLYVMLAISDNGCGMSKEVKKQIFDPFFTTKEPGKGTGLGISTAYGIIKQSGGNIWVYSEINEGTTFKIYFPAEIAKEAIKKELTISGKLRKFTATVLVVEDNSTLCNMIGEILETENIKTFLVTKPLEAIEVYKEHQDQIDMVLTDVIMPEMSGKILVENLKNINPAIKALFMSGYTDNAIAHKGVLNENVNFIQKPFVVKDLVKAIYETIFDEKIED